MTIEGWTLILLFTALTVALAQPVGAFLFALYEGRTTPLHRVLGPVERGYRLAGIRPEQQTWRAYALHMLLFQLVLTVFTYALLRFQAVLPLNPRAGRHWRRWRDEHRHRLRHQHQLAVVRRRKHDEQSQPDAGADHSQLPVGGHRHRHRLRAVPRFRPARGGTIGNFWADCTRVTLYLLLPPASSMRCFWWPAACRRRWRRAWT
jgi:K+-transporting ATPase ATPase A chain